MENLPGFRIQDRVRFRVTVKFRHESEFGVESGLQFGEYLRVFRAQPLHHRR